MKKYILISFSIFLISCQTKDKFDKKNWVEQSDLGRYPNRKYIIDDLAKNYKLTGKSYNEIIELLGEPFPKFDFRTDTTMLYPVDIIFGKDDQLTYTKALWLKLGKDSVVQSFEVTEWKKSSN